MANVVALVLEFDVVLFSEAFLYLRDVLESVSKDVGFGILYVLLLPVEFKRFVTLRQSVKLKVHASHVQRAHLRRDNLRGLDPIFNSCQKAAASGYVEHGIRVGSDLRYEGQEVIRIQ